MKKIFLLLTLVLLISCYKDESLIVPHDYSTPCFIEAFGGDDYVLSINFKKWHQSGYFDTIIPLHVFDTIMITSYGDALRVSIDEHLYLDTIHNGFFQTTIPISDP